MTVTPSDDKTTYFAGVTESSSVEGLADEELVAEMVARSDFDKCLYMGKKDVLATGLKADTDYTVVVFSYQNKEVGAVVKKTVRTQKEGDGPTPGDFKIEITVTDITHNSAKVKVTPSDDTVDYYVNVFPKSEVERDGKMLEGWEFIEYYGQDPYIGNKTQKGVYERSLSGLSSSYSYVVAAYDLSQDEEVVYYEFLTTKAPDVPDQFQITNIQPTTTGVTFTVTPQSADEWYCAWITTKSTYESFEPESYIQGVYYGLNNIAVDKEMTMSDYVKSIAKQGTAEWSNYDGDLKPKTDYVILAFYVDPYNEDQLTVYDYAYTKAEFRTETPETEISVVAYCLKITQIDPLKYDLLFERFLNPDRISLPDIDVDFDDDGRGRVLQWVTEKYGAEKVAHIITYGTMATKLAIKDVARVQKLPLPESDRLTRLIPDRLPEKNGKAQKINLKNCIENVKELQEACNSSNELLANTMKYAQMLEGNVRNTGVHACGVIIGRDDITDWVPVSTADDKETGEKMLVTQYEGSVIEDTGLIKMDFLGLKTLSIIKEAVENIRQTRHIDLDIDSIPIDDPKTYELYSAGRTTGTFQFESAGMQKYLRELHPTTFEDLIAMNEIGRASCRERV